MSDLKLIETGSGGDVCFDGRDLIVIEGFENMPYLGWFGGNIESNTQEFQDGEERFDWWGNELLMAQNSKIQFNSDLERLLLNIALTSSSILQLDETIKSDLSFMSDFSNIEVSTNILSVDKLKISTKLKEPNNLESKEFVYIWDATKKELIKEF